MKRFDRKTITSGPITKYSRLEGEVVTGPNFSAAPFRRRRQVCSDFEFIRCSFDNYTVAVRADLANRPVIRNCRLVDCSVHATYLNGAIVEDTIIDGLRTSARTHLLVFGAVFKHVTLRGKIGTLISRPYTHLFDDESHPERDQQFKQANAAYYEQVDWAIDIREAQAAEITLIGVPARLIRRDPATQAVVRRATLADDKWKAIDLGKAYWHVTIQEMLDGGFDDVVLVAPKRSTNYAEHLRGIEILRSERIADPD
ncbi:MAG TPA: hypothetical protein VI056_12860 [Candidatus Limnocylindria bacterium]